MGGFDSLQTVEDVLFFRAPIKLLGYEAIYQRWYLWGEVANSVIFETSDLNGLSDELLVERLKSVGVGRMGTKYNVIKMKNGFTAVEYDFEPLE